MSSGDPSFPALRPNEYRNAWCGQVLPDRVGQTARVGGWVHRRRDHGGLVFIDLRDRTGLVQLVFNPDTAAGAFELGHALRSEDVLTASGEVLRRSPETVNPDLPTGEVEIHVSDAELLADAETPPFEIESFSGEVGEETRLRYRYLDLRRDRMRRAIELRHRVVRAIREFFDGEGFVDIETPMLSRSTPEGARDFLVPWRREPGTFFALPQSPQLFKQLLMIAGFERYYQIVRCFRDEDQRADRQLDFTQLDVEMSFVDAEDVLDVNERMLAHVLDRVAGPALEVPIPRLAYDDAMSRYGTDRPDTRFGMELVDVSAALRGSEFKVFAGTIEGGGTVKGLNAGRRDLPRSALDALIDRAQELGAKGLVWAFREGDGWRSPTAKFLSAEELRSVNAALGAEEGDLVLLVADDAAVAGAVLGALRLELGERFDLRHGEEFVWIVDWPMFGWSAEESRWDPLHHPFTAPDGEFDPDRPGEARARAYDIVWNGQEMGGGSIRISDTAVQEQVFRVIGIGEQDARNRFGFLLDALRYGAPPHGGIAYGLDRIVQRLIDSDNIRDGIAFPKTASGADPLTGAPATVDEAQLRELGLALRGRRQS
ncbi:MAG TPA: aspartate--tRNA ligase [Solirubrobacterales bacterium]|jgi:aspartyl-tRNA synthetase|nr:aspartate--tRNA ligase [Solirubrobacterales bacterium]